jgi:Ca2+-binding EF-hand superfamily protein
MLRRLLTFAFVLALAVPALADDPKPAKKGQAWEKEWERLLKLYDKDGDGQISKEELAAAKADAEKKGKQEPQDPAKKTDGDDKKTNPTPAPDGKKPHSKHTPGAQLEKHFDEIDTNKDGKISKEEFKAYVEKAAEKKAEKKSEKKGTDQPKKDDDSTKKTDDSSKPADPKPADPNKPADPKKPADPPPATPK